MLSYIIPFLVLFFVVTFVHEYGHYYFAKRYGVKVTVFSLGIGKELFGWTDKAGVRWKLSPIPLACYVKFYGDHSIFSEYDKESLRKQYPPEDHDKLLAFKTFSQKAMILLAGPFANFILAIAIFASIYTFVGKDFTPASIAEVQANSPAFIAGVKKDDVIVSIDGENVKSIMEVSKYITLSTSDYINFTVSRVGQEIELKVKPNMVETTDGLGNDVKKRMIGIKLIPYNNKVNHVKVGPAKALFYATSEVYYITTSMYKYVWLLIRGKGDPKSLGGPIRIAKISGQVAQFGFLAFISTVAYISISLGAMNLLPIPLLDGGHLLINFIDRIKTNGLSGKSAEFLYRIGFVIIGSLVIFTTFNDLNDVGLFEFFNNYIS